RDHLDDAGNLCVWIPDNHCLESDFQLILRTFHNVFPHCQVWVSPEGTGYYLIGAHQPLVIRPQRMQATQANPRVTADISEYAVRWSWSVATLRLLFALDTAGVERYVHGESRTLTDDRPYTEFPWLEWVRLGNDERSRRWMKVPKLVPHYDP